MSDRTTYIDEASFLPANDWRKLLEEEMAHCNRKRWPGEWVWWSLQYGGSTFIWLEPDPEYAKPT